MTDEIIKRLDTLIRLTAAGLGAGRPQGERILMMAHAGMAAREIAEILGTTSNTVSVTIYAAKKRTAPKAKRVKDVPADDTTESEDNLKE